MKKNSYLHDNEIDLIVLSKIIWDGKIKILLITTIAFLVGFGYDSGIPKNYLNSLTINPSKNTEFTKIENIKKLLISNQSIQSFQSNQSNQLDQSNQFNQRNQIKVGNQLYQSLFIKELEDYEEFLLVLKNTKKVQEQFLKIKIEDQELELFKYAKLLEIVKSKKNEESYIINFKWHDPNEAIKILQETLNLVTINLKNLIHSEFFQAIEYEKKILIDNDRQRLDYLREQSSIAKELNIIDNQIDNLNLNQSNVSLSINTADIAYYLRGFKAIDKEIELIENRSYQNFKLIQKELDSLKKDNFKWADYNVYLMDIKSLKDTKKIIVISILLGLIIGVFYVLISNAFQSTRSS